MCWYVFSMENEGGSRKLSPVLEESNDILQGSGDEEKLLNGHAGTTDQFVNTRCRFYIEPMLFLFALSQFPLMQISSQYIYKREWERIDVNGTFNYSFDAPTNHCIADPDDQLSQLRSKVQSAASYFSLQTALCSTIPAIFTSLFLGAYSDRVGRKYAIIPPILGQMVSSFLYAIVIHFNLPIQVLFVGAFLYGCCGYYVAFLLGCLAYVADTTTKVRGQEIKQKSNKLAHVGLKEEKAKEIPYLVTKIWPLLWCVLIDIQMYCPLYNLTVSCYKKISILRGA